MVLQVVFILLTFLCVVVATSGLVMIASSRVPAPDVLAPARVGRHAPPPPRSTTLWGRVSFGLIATCAGAPLALLAAELALWTSDFPPFTWFALVVMSLIAAIGAITSNSK